MKHNRLRKYKRSHKKYAKITNIRRYTRRYKKNIRLIGGGVEKHYYNRYSHYGDCILNLKFFFNIRDHLKKDNIVIHYYYLPDIIQNAKELEVYADPECIVLHSTTKPDTATELWMGNPVTTNNSKIIEYKTIEPYYNETYKQILKDIGLSNKNIDTSLYQKEDYIYNIYEKLNIKFKNIDILFINGKPNTDKFVYDKEKMDALAITLSEKYKIVTTEEVNDSITSTRKGELTIQDIGAIATHVSYIIAVHTGPMVACYNADTKKHVKHWFLLNALETRTDYKEIPVTYIESPTEFTKIIEYITSHPPTSK